MDLDGPDLTPVEQLEYYKNLKVNADCSKTFPLLKLKNFIPILNILDKYIEDNDPIINNSEFPNLITKTLEIISFIILISDKTAKDIPKNPELLTNMQEIFNNIINNDFNVHTNVKSIVKFLKEKKIKIIYIDQDSVKETDDLWGDFMHSVLSYFFNHIFESLKLQQIVYAANDTDKFRKALYEGFAS